MRSIEAKGLTKEFKLYRSRPGLTGAFRDLLNRQYTTVRAVDAIDLSVDSGEVVGYIGENGAGKSTTIKMLTGILEPTSGVLKVNGFDPHRERESFVRTIGVVFGQRSQLWWDIAVRESFRLLQKLYRVPEGAYGSHMDRLIEVLDIGSLLDQPVRKLSLGQRMRCELAAALIHQPRLVFLDEPTIGLDVLVKENIRQFLRQVNQEYGTTILLTTHDISDIEALCHRVVMLDRGRIIYDGGLEELRQQWSGKARIRFVFGDRVSLRNLQQWAGEVADWHKEDDRRFIAQLNTMGETGMSDLLNRLTPHVPIQEVRLEETTTEEIVRRIYREGIRHA
ncbi:ABC transporter ATP-binding protein [Desmospora profundinema]|uniref:ABC-2 type transport system ATP-binding protein n=1 Tax=Desmospora profundinema TaxID=1571184 RepID=A0ABU1IS86_9BACL|nr:ATP-binding cassette domain-containing protein [Desmospora profundinema]MDR6227610.1 ABC-2 type transport system ATP-binding protein [Desmospora profundinema]